MPKQGVVSSQAAGQVFRPGASRHCPVAQISNLPYRRLVVGEVLPAALRSGLQIRDRLQVCATTQCQAPVGADAPGFRPGERAMEHPDLLHLGFEEVQTDFELLINSNYYLRVSR